MSAGSGFDIQVRDRISASIIRKLTQIEALSVSATAGIAGLNTAMGAQAAATNGAGNATGSFTRRVLQMAFGISNAQDNLRSFTTHIRSTGQAMRAFASGVLLLGATGAIFAAADSYRNLQNTLRGATSSQSELNEVTRQLYGVANRARVPVGSLAQAYRRIDQALKPLGASAEESMRITETVSKSFILSGATAEESASSLLQLGQAFNKGKLDGDEFRTVAENMPQLLDAVAEASGITRSEIYDMSKDGKINVDILRKAFTMMAEDVDKRMKDLPRTIGQAFTQFGNKASQVFGQFDKQFGFTDAITGFLDYLGNNLPTVIDWMKAFAAAAAVMIPTALVAVIGPVGAAIASLPTIFAGAVAYMAYFSDEIKVTSDGVVTLTDLISAIKDNIMGFISFVTGTSMDELFNPSNAQMLYDAVVIVGEALRDAFQYTKAWVVSFAEALSIASQFPAEGAKTTNVFPGLSLASEAIAAPFAAIKDQILEVGAVLVSAFETPLKNVVITLDQIIKQFGEIADAIGKSMGFGMGNPLSGAATQLKKGLGLSPDFIDSEGKMTKAIRSMKTDWQQEFPVFMQFVEEFDAAWERNFSNIKQNDKKFWDDLIEQARGYAQKRIELDKEIQRGNLPNPSVMRQADPIQGMIHRQESEALRAEAAIKELSKKGGMLSALSDGKGNNFTPEFKMQIAEANLANEGFSRSILQVALGLKTMKQHLSEVTAQMQQYDQAVPKPIEGSTATPQSQTSEATMSAISEIASQAGVSLLGLNSTVGMISTAITALQPNFEQITQSATSFAATASQAFNEVSYTAGGTGTAISSSIESAMSAAGSAISTFASNAIADLNAVADAASQVDMMNIGGGSGSGTGAGFLSGAFGFADGGYTGNGHSSSIAGVVHGREYVMPADQTARYRPILEAMRAGRSIGGGGGTSVQVQNFGSSKITVEKLSETDIRIIAREESARTVRDQAPLAIANNLRNPNSKVSKSLQQNTKAERRR